MNVKEASMDEESPLLLPEEAAEMLRVRVSWLYRQARKGEFPSVSVGRYVRFRKADVENFIATGGGTE